MNTPIPSDASPRPRAGATNGAAGSPMALPPNVMKFGGTSVGSAGALRQVVRLVETAAQARRVVVVTSALSKVTRLLKAGAAHVAGGEAAVEEVVEAVRSRHTEQARQVLAAETVPRYAAVLEEHLGALRQRLEQVRAEGLTPPLGDAVLATGEQLSVPMVALALADAGLPAEAFDATRLVRTDATHGAARVDTRRTAALIQRWFAALPGESLPVVAGFIGRAESGGGTTTLGFEGSDYSAALFAAALQAAVLERWTDVDGLYTKDPRTHEDAERIREIVLEEAAALNESGRLGMHPKALRPLAGRGIPVHIRCTAAPEQPGTRLVPQQETASAEMPPETSAPEQR